MKLQEVPGQSRETAGPWEDWLKDPEHKQYSPLSFQLQGIMREKQKEPADQYLVPSLVSLEEFGVFGSWCVNRSPGLLVTDGVHLSQRGKGILAQELAGLIETVSN